MFLNSAIYSQLKRSAEAKKLATYGLDSSFQPVHKYSAHAFSIQINCTLDFQADCGPCVSRGLYLLSTRSGCAVVRIIGSYVLSTLSCWEEKVSQEHKVMLNAKQIALTQWHVGGFNPAPPSPPSPLQKA